MDSYSMSPAEAHYSQQAQRQQQWPPHLLMSHPQHTQSPFPSPVSPPASSISEHGQHYPPFYHQQQQQQQQPGQGQGQPQQSQQSTGETINHMNGTSTSLSLNLSSLSVTSPTNLSPINPPSTHPAAALSPVTPISPSHPFNHHHQHPHHNIQSQFQFSPPDISPPSSSHQNSNQSQTIYDDQGQYDRRVAATPTTSRSSSSSTSSTSLPRKRSFTGNAPSGTLLEETMYDTQDRDAAMELTSGYDDLEMRSSYVGGPTGGGGSPVEGSGSTSGEEGLSGAGHGAGMGVGVGVSVGSGIGIGSGVGVGVGGSMNILGKPLATNNFVTKLYQMINDSKSALFISWTEHGTSFVVSNVGEFSRSILGSHFKHNNFSSFVRQLNMYGFHKINRTPRAQRTSTDSQTWEFSHHKFLRGRPDLLDEIKRKALEPDPATKHRVELPGEVAVQLGAMREENRRVWEQLMVERRRADKLVNVVGRLWDVVGKGFPGSVPPFPSDLLESNDSPNIYITSPTASTSRYPPPLSMNMSGQSLHSMHSLSSPNSSPTAADFPTHLQHHHHHPQSHSLSRQHSFQHVSFTRNEAATSTPLPPSPGSIVMDLFDDGGGGEPTGVRGGTKRQRMSNDEGGVGTMNGAGGSSDSLSVSSSMSSLSTPGTAQSVVSATGKKLSRARSDSAPLGYGLGLSSWHQGGSGGRPRSGSGMAGPRGLPGVGPMTRANGTPLLSISTVTNNSNSPSR